MNKNFAVIGNPVEHSLSPGIHQLFAKQFDISLTYNKITCDPNNFVTTVNEFFVSDGFGMNVTVPFKIKAFEMMHTLSHYARVAQAVNTIKINTDATYYGDNTDGLGFVRDVENNLQFTLRNKQILIIGAGGATRGLLAPIIEQSPALCHIANRTEAKAIYLAEQFECSGSSIEKMPQHAFDLVINASSASLHGDMPALPKHCIGEHTLAYDLCYAANSTAFMQWCAQQRAQQCVDGLGMLVEQAALGFALWHDQAPQTKQVINAIRQEMSHE